MKSYDIVGTNLFESQGNIEIPNFNFISSNYEIWKGGKCIENLNCNIGIEVRELPNRNISVNIKNNTIRILPDCFLFSGRSLSNDRVLLNKGELINQDNVNTSPEYMSIFFYKSFLDTIAFTFDDPQILIEFHS